MKYNKLFFFFGNNIPNITGAYKKQKEWIIYGGPY